MQTRFKNLFLLPVLIACLGFIPAGRTTAQTFTTLHNFTGSDGNVLWAGLTLSSNTLYGTAQNGGSYGNFGNGTVFAINTDGTGFTNLYSFTGGSDGGYPVAGLILSGNTLYGTTQSGGSSGKGTVFAINTDGTGFTNLYSFTGSGGASPVAGLILSGNTLYGTTQSGGSSDYGTVFAINTDGTGFTNLYSFTGDSDGGYPVAGLILSGNKLYGTATSGGVFGIGTVFAINTDGTGFTNLHSFTGGDGPNAGVILSGNILYGATDYDGSSGHGSVFAINTDGTGFTNLYSFPDVNQGSGPLGSLILSGNTLYGTTFGGGSGSLGSGTVFAINTDGTDFTNLYIFNGYDGENPAGSLILSDNTLYGTTVNGATVFSLTLPVIVPQLAIIPSGANFIVAWPTNADSFTLQSTTNLAPPAVWDTVSPDPVVVNGQNTVTNAITGDQQFFRLSHP